MKKCNCDYCKRDRQFEKIIDRIKKSEFMKKDITWLYDLYDHLQSLEFELSMLKNKDKIGEVMIDPDDWTYIVGLSDNE